MNKYIRGGKVKMYRVKYETTYLLEQRRGKSKWFDKRYKANNEAIRLINTWGESFAKVKIQTKWFKSYKLYKGDE